MRIKDQPKTKASVKTTHTTIIAIMVMVVCLIVIIGTIELSKVSDFKFITDHRNAIVSVELTIFVITLVEVIGRELSSASVDAVSSLLVKASVQLFGGRSISSLLSVLYPPYYQIQPWR